MFSFLQKLLDYTTVRYTFQISHKRETLINRNQFYRIDNRTLIFGMNA